MIVLHVAVRSNITCYIARNITLYCTLYLLVASMSFREYIFFFYWETLSFNFPGINLLIQYCEYIYLYMYTVHSNHSYK